MTLSEGVVCWSDQNMSNQNVPWANRGRGGFGGRGGRGEPPPAGQEVSTDGTNNSGTDLSTSAPEINKPNPFGERVKRPMASSAGIPAKTEEPTEEANKPNPFGDRVKRFGADPSKASAPAPAPASPPPSVQTSPFGSGLRKTSPAGFPSGAGTSAGALEEEKPNPFGGLKKAQASGGEVTPPASSEEKKPNPFGVLKKTPSAVASAEEEKKPNPFSGLKKVPAVGDAQQLSPAPAEEKKPNPFGFRKAPASAPGGEETAPTAVTEEKKPNPFGGLKKTPLAIEGEALSSQSSTPTEDTKPNLFGGLKKTPAASGGEATPPASAEEKKPSPFGGLKKTPSAVASAEEEKKPNPFSGLKKVPAVGDAQQLAPAPAEEKKPNPFGVLKKAAGSDTTPLASPLPVEEEKKPNLFGGLKKAPATPTGGGEVSPHSAPQEVKKPPFGGLKKFPPVSSSDAASEPSAPAEEKKPNPFGGLKKTPTSTAAVADTTTTTQPLSDDKPLEKPNPFGVLKKSSPFAEKLQEENKPNPLEGRRKGSLTAASPVSPATDDKVVQLGAEEEKKPNPFSALRKTGAAPQASAEEKLSPAASHIIAPSAPISKPASPPRSGSLMSESNLTPSDTSENPMTSNTELSPAEALFSQRVMSAAEAMFSQRCGTPSSSPRPASAAPSSRPQAPTPKPIELDNSATEEEILEFFVSKSGSLEEEFDDEPTSTSVASAVSIFSQARSVEAPAPLKKPLSRPIPPSAKSKIVASSETTSDLSPAPTFQAVATSDPPLAPPESFSPAPAPAPADDITPTVSVSPPSLETETSDDQPSIERVPKRASTVFSALPTQAAAPMPKRKVGSAIELPRRRASTAPIKPGGFALPRRGPSSLSSSSEEDKVEEGVQKTEEEGSPEPSETINSEVDLSALSSSGERLHCVGSLLPFFLQHTGLTYISF